jgi:DNA mismatch endonuclease (patch repair protein)
MTDVFTRTKRSEVMSRIRGRGNLSTEMRMIALMREHGIKGWRRNRRLPGRPDFVFPAEKIAVFVDGCFWHGCPVHYREPASSSGFWRTKVSTNRRRDRRVNRKLRANGWRVIRVWEHDLTRKSSGGMIARFRRFLSRERLA